MNIKKAIVKRRSDWPPQYLTGVRCFCYGEKVLACYSEDPHCAMPLTEDQCRSLLPMLREEFPPSAFHCDKKSGVPALSFSVVDYPCREVSGNG